MVKLKVGAGTIRGWQQMNDTLAHVCVVAAEDLESATKQVTFYKKDGLLYFNSIGGFLLVYS